MSNPNPNDYHKTIAAPKTAGLAVAESGSGTNTDANSYISLADANDYMAGSLYAEEWNAATDANKNLALISATRTLDANCIWRGYRKLTQQPLGWPRVLAKNDDYWIAGLPIGIYSARRYWSENEIPFYLSQGTALEALELLRVDRTKDPELQGISSIGLGQSALTMTFTGNKADLPKPLSEEVRKTVVPLVTSFRGTNVVRRVVRVQ